jgi:hypothetical protein
MSLREFPSLGLARREYRIARMLITVARWSERQQISGRELWQKTTGEFLSMLEREQTAERAGRGAGTFAYWLPPETVAARMQVVAMLQRNHGDAAYQHAFVLFRRRWTRIADRRYADLSSDDREDGVQGALIDLCHPVVLFVLRPGTGGRLSRDILSERLRAARRARARNSSTIDIDELLDTLEDPTHVDDEDRIEQGRLGGLLRLIADRFPALAERLRTGTDPSRGGRQVRRECEYPRAAMVRRSGAATANPRSAWWSHLQVGPAATASRTALLSKSARGPARSPARLSFPRDPAGGGSRYAGTFVTSPWRRRRRQRSTGGRHRILNRCSRPIGILNVARCGLWPEVGVQLSPASGVSDGDDGSGVRDAEPALCSAAGGVVTMAKLQLGFDGCDAPSHVAAWQSSGDVACPDRRGSRPSMDEAPATAPPRSAS